ncbi:asialoglycoprotein receptor 2-like [Ostrea edulis]|uniref:asialoglycoprotein receptor 2-like n=1 Tax=Ostrea edulis TaxID=37623 RepID=UPI002095F858|nr:asialoglycoprotein receptor 2-like [Ostrea edulis]
MTVQLQILTLVACFCFFENCKGDGCHSGWIAFGEKCYMLSRMPEPWATASSYCQSYHGKLTEPTTQEEVTFLANHVHQLKMFFWIGVSDVIVENQWIYSSTQTNLTVSNWKHGQPDGHSGENCALMDGHSNGQWRDWNCNSSLRFICEKYIEESTPPSSQIIG